MNENKPGVISIFSLKGGVGKTTIAYGLATALIKAKHRVAFLDGDYSNPVAHLLFGIPHIRHKTTDDYGIAPISIDRLQYASVAFLFSPTGNSRQTSSRRAQVLSELGTSLRWDPYDYLIIDMAPSSTDENRIIINSLDPSVVIVAEKGPLAERGLERSVKFLQTSQARVLGVVGNKGFDAKNLAKEFGIPYLTTVPFSEDPQINPSPFLKAAGKRLGKTSLKRKGKRRLLRVGLETYVKVREWTK